MKYSNSADILNNLEDSYCETKMNSVWDEYWVILAHYNFDIMVFSILFAYTNNMSNSGIKMCKLSFWLIFFVFPLVLKIIGFKERVA